MSRILDSHIHLYESSHLPDLAWAENLSDPHCLLTQNSMYEYSQAADASCDVRGFIFVETDRKSGLYQNEWQYVLEEVRYMVSVTTAVETSSESTARHKSSALAIIPWAPIPAGRDDVALYMRLVKAECGSSAAWDLVKGVRYLFQDKPVEIMRDPGVIEGLQWLAENSLTFDLGVDARTGGLNQLDCAYEMLQKVSEGGAKLTTIINHMCKPNLRLTQSAILDDHVEFVGWETCMQNFASLPRTFMKLSGAFSELPPQEEHRPQEIASLVEQLRPWFAVLLDSFGASRIMFGSDWPVCNVGGPGPKLSWSHWQKTVAGLLDDAKLSEDAKADIWHNTAARAYNMG